MTKVERGESSSGEGPEVDPRLENIRKYQAEGGQLAAEDAAYLREAGGELTSETAAEVRESFKGQDAEVTVKRSGNLAKGVPGWLEGGWNVVGPDKEKPGYMVVSNENRNWQNGAFIKNPSALHKSVKVENLLKLQPFQKGESVSVPRSGGKIDTEGWTIGKDLGFGHYKVEKGEIYKDLSKAQLIEAKIAELSLKQNEIVNLDPVAADAEKLVKIEEDLKYWRDKLDTINRLGK